MIASYEQLVALCANSVEPDHGWRDARSLKALVAVAQEYGALGDVAIYRLLADEPDTFLISVDICPGVSAHSAPISWREIRPEPDLKGVDAVRQVLERLGGVADEVRANFLREVAEVVSAAVMPREDGTNPAR